MVELNNSFDEKPEWLTMDEIIAYGKELTGTHRYLQQQMFKVFIGFMRQLAFNYQKGSYEQRNEWASRLAATAYDRLTEENLIYDPEYINMKAQ